MLNYRQLHYFHAVAKAGGGGEGARGVDLRLVAEGLLLFAEIVDDALRSAPLIGGESSRNMEDA